MAKDHIPKQKRGELTRATLITAAISEFTLRGVAKTSVEQIARAAQVSKGAFFYHFGSKANLIDEVEKNIRSGDPAISDLEPFLKRLQTEPNARLLVEIALNGRF